MVADSEAATAKLLDSCGLDWRDSCLSFPQTERPARTASLEVR
jgi:hypothetical protein